MSRTSIDPNAYANTDADAFLSGDSECDSASDEPFSGPGDSWRLRREGPGGRSDPHPASFHSQETGRTNDLPLRARNPLSACSSLAWRPKSAWPGPRDRCRIRLQLPAIRPILACTVNRTSRGQPAGDSPVRRFTKMSLVVSGPAIDPPKSGWTPSVREPRSPRSLPGRVRLFQNDRLLAAP
jgi:hypothetical protein